MNTTRISGGDYARHLIKQPGEGTRPVSQLVRESIFDVLGHDLTGLNALDLYAGSGALGIEAISRGVTDVVFVENNRKAATVIKENLDTLSLTAGVQVTDVESYLQTSKSDYDLIFFDPPYADFSVETAILAAKRLVQDGILIVSCSKREALPDKLGAASIVKAKNYDNTKIAYYKR